MFYPEPELCTTDEKRDKVVLLLGRADTVKELEPLLKRVQAAGFATASIKAYQKRSQ